MLRLTVLNLSNRSDFDISGKFPTFFPIKITSFNLEEADKREAELTFLKIMEIYEKIENIDYIVLPKTPEAACWVGYELAQNQKIGESLPMFL